MGIAKSDGENESSVSKRRREAIYCDDCGREKLAELRDGKLVIKDRRHGKLHMVSLPTPIE